MIAQSRYIVIYKDHGKARNSYFGPFMSINSAESFMDVLPPPQPGGCKTFKSLQPYTHDESHLARDVILNKRQRGELLDIIQDIVRTATPPT